MNDWLGLPWVHDGLVPFLVGLATAELFNRLRLSGLAVIAAIAAAVHLSHPSAFTLEPHTAFDRLMLVALAATVLGLAFDLMPRLRRWAAALSAVIAGGLVVWMTWPAATPQHWTAVLVPAGLGILYAVWTTGSLVLLADYPERAAAAGIALGVAVAAIAMLTGRAPLVTVASAAAAACAAHWLIQLLSNERLQCGTTLTLPLAAACALIPPTAVLNQAVSWYLLPLLALIPAVAVIPLSERLQLRLRALLALGLTAATAAGVIAIAYLVIGPPVKAA